MVGSLFVNSAPDAPAVSVEVQIAEMRRMLQLSLSEVTEVESDARDLEALIAELLGHGVSRQEIAFLIAESVPFNAPA